MKVIKTVIQQRLVNLTSFHKSINLANAIEWNLSEEKTIFVCEKFYISANEESKLDLIEDMFISILTQFGYELNI